MKKEAGKRINIATATSPYTVQVASDVQVMTFYGNKTLSANFAIQASGTPATDVSIAMIFTGNITTGANTFSIFGINLDSDIVKLPFFAMCYYTNSTWSVLYGRLKGVTFKTGGGIDEDPTTGGIKIASNIITNAMINSAAAIDYSKLALTGAILNADINASAAIAYSKLALAGAILNADINASAAIAYSKLALTGSIVNADINSAAAIAFSKMVALTASRVAITDGSGVLSAADTATYPSLAELAYLKGATSNLQTQITARETVTNVAAYVAALSADIAAINTGIKTYSTISSNTTLTAATLKQNIRIDATAGAVDVTLPDASTVTAGFTTHWVVLGANAVRILAHGAQNLRDLSNNDVSTLTITGAANIVDTLCDGTDTFYQT